MIFFDDMSSLVQNYEDDFVYYWTIASHHFNTSFFLVLHSLFSPALRILSLNTHRFFLTKSPRDVSQVRTLASQAFPGRSPFVVYAYEDATDQQYGFLILDFSPNCDSRLRVMGNIFGEEPAAVYQYKEVVKSQMTKMENRFRKQALIPWSEFLRLRSKPEPNNATCPTKSSCGNSSTCQSVIHQCEKPIIYDNRSPMAPPPVSEAESPDDGKTSHHSPKVEILASGTNESSSVTPSKPEVVPTPTYPVTPSLPPILHSISPTPISSKTIVLKSPGRSRHPSLKKALKGKKPSADSRAIQSDWEISSSHLPLTLPSSQPIPPLTHVPLSPISPPSTSTPLPSSALPLRAIEHLPPSSSVLPALTYSPSPPLTSQRKQVKGVKKVVEPVRAKENLGPKPPDSIYPKSLLRDQDIQPNPLTFPSKIWEKKKKKNMKSKIFLPSPPYTSVKIPKKALKRENTFSKPRPTLPPKQIKYNHGEKRKFEGREAQSKKSRKVLPSANQRTKSLGDTDFDIW